MRRSIENVKPTPETVTDIISDNAILPSTNTQDELVVRPVETTAATVSDTVQKDTQVSQDAISSSINEPDPDPSMSQSDTLLHQNHDSFLLELENSEQSQWTRSSGVLRSQIVKAAKERPAPRLSSHSDWEKSEMVSSVEKSEILSPVEELQKRLSKHATVSASVDVETTDKTVNGEI